MEQKAVELVSVLRNSNLSMDAKITHLLGLKSDIKQKNVPQGAVPPIFEALQVSIASPHSALYTAGFSTLGHFFKRLVIQDMHNLISAFARDLITCLMDRLSDHKQRIRDLAQQALLDVQPFAPQQIEDMLHVSFKSRNYMVKDCCLLLLNSMHDDRDISFKQFVPDMVLCLEDAHPKLRDTAKTVIQDLFYRMPDFAKQDLKRQMAEQHVKLSTQNDILTHLGMEVDHPITRPSSTRPPSVRPPSRGDAIRRPPSRGDVLHRPPSRGDVLHRPPSRGEALRKPKLASSNLNTPSHSASASVAGPAPVEDSHYSDSNWQTVDDAVTGPAPAHSHVHPFISRPHSAFSEYAEQTAEGPSESKTAPLTQRHKPADSDHLQDTPVVVRPVPIKANTYKAPKKTDASIDKHTAPKIPRHTETEVDKKAVPAGVAPRHVSSVRELEQIFHDMLPCFEGKEEETNWQKRENAVKMIRRITWGNAPHDFTQAYLKEIKSMYDGIFKVANSVRTSLQTNGLLTLQSLAVVNGSRLDPSMDLIMPHALKICSMKKNITSENGNLTVIVLLENVTCNSRILQHVKSAASDNNFTLRGFTPGWFSVIINSQDRHKTTPEGVAEIAQCIKNGVADAKDNIRAAYRSTFWDFYKFWPERARQLLEEVQPKHRALIEKDPANQMHDPFLANLTSLAGSKTPVRQSVKAAIASSRAKANLAKSLPPPAATAESAQSSQPRKKVRPAATGTPTSSLTSAPMRPGAAKPRTGRNDLAARPATAVGNYRKPNETTPRGSPVRKSVAQTSTPTKSSLGPTRPRQKSDPLQNASPAKKASQGNISDETNNKYSSNHPSNYSSNHSSTYSSDHAYESINIPKTRAKKNDGNIGEIRTDENENNKNTPEIQNENKFENGAENDSAALIEVPVLTSPARQRKVSVSEAIETTLNAKEAFRRASSDEEKENRERNDGANTAPKEASSPAKEVRTESQGFPAEAVEPAVEESEPRPLRKRTSVLSAVDWSTSAGDDEEGDSAWDALNDAVQSGQMPAPRSPTVNNQAGLPSPPAMTPDLQDKQEPAPASENEPSDTISQAVRAVRRISDRFTGAAARSGRRDISPRSQDPTKAPEMLAKAFERIKHRDLDMTGYRRLQGLLAFHQHELFTDKEQFDDVLGRLLDEMKTPLPPPIQTMPFGTQWDYKTQVLCTVKCMFLYADKYFDASAPFIVTELLSAEKLDGMTRRLERAIDNMIDDVVDRNEPFAIIDSVIYYLSNGQKDPGHKVFQKGFDVIGHALVNLNERNSKLDKGTLQKIGQLAIRSLKDETPGVQRRVVAMCVELRAHVEDQDRFWELMGLHEMDESHRGMRALFYYYDSKKAAAAK
ncbi:clasp N terminal-domain-containing protein [Aspergillus venezuelensis]